MYKYYRFIEQEQHLLLNVRRNDIAFVPDLSFYEKYEDIFKRLGKIKKVFDKLDTDTVWDKLRETFLDWEERGDLIDEYNRSKEVLDDLSIRSYNYEVEFYLFRMNYLLDVFEAIYPDFENYAELKKEIESMQKELKRKITSKDDIQDIVIPTDWYLTKNGMIYNNSLEKKTSKIRRNIYPFDTDYSKEKEILIKKLEKIKNNGCVEHKDYVWYLGYVGDPTMIIRGKSYNRIINECIMGILDSVINMYDLFETLQKEDNKKVFNELYKLSDDDLYIKVLQMSKIDVDNKRIYTRNPNLLDFVNYIEKDYVVKQLEPIEFEKEKVKKKNRI